MKRILSILCVAAWIGVGCSPDSAPPDETTASGSESSGSSGQGYLGTVSQAKQTVQKKLAVAPVQQAIQLFHAQEGRYPKNLQELVPDYLPAIPEVPAGYRLNYDPATGDLKIVQQ